MDFAATFGSSLPLRRQRILCAEDSPQMADLVREVLERAGHEVVCVADGQQAWDRVRANPAYFDAVVTDFQMPAMNGLQLVRQLRTLRFAGKIIVQSGRVSPQEEAAFARLGVHRIVHKPSGLFDLPELLT